MLLAPLLEELGLFVLEGLHLLEVLLALLARLGEFLRTACVSARRGHAHGGSGGTYDFQTLHGGEDGVESRLGQLGNLHRGMSVLVECEERWTYGFGGLLA